MIKAVIFDFDGTIIDTETPWFEIYQTVLKDDYHFDLTLEEFVKIVGTTNDTLFDKIDQTLKEPMDRLLFKERTHEHYLKIKDDLPLRDGFLETLQRIQENGIKLAIASSSHREWIVGFLEKYNLTEYFPIICSAEDVEEVKPNPALYIKAIEALGIEPDEAVAVEDSVNGSLAAIRAGINCLIIPNDVTKSLTFHENAKLIQSYAEFDCDHYLRKDTWIAKLMEQS
ncbi:HAD family hydrolase [Lederbergia wuyishanensis]|uniref:Hydrolase of the HAD superfamily n=1 Tax=Lederbergia wuyishanensis TaxID=1347903 RepID=A0ABU0D5R2_9BACI|nr:HAD family hydrolase [Lederbergia wuyishanensis]MCJ8008323.1 HAD family hydrolase [Lederbergia wuyishanensis]MDQ0343735.1 putative hydrolase of the HAD superfamily [Lederbergia wuyishanensis]